MSRRAPAGRAGAGVSELRQPGPRGEDLPPHPHPPPPGLLLAVACVSPLQLAEKLEVGAPLPHFLHPFSPLSF